MKLLLAEDDPTIQAIARMVLKRAQFEVTVVDNGAQAVTRALADRPDVIVLDWMMPEMDGFEACRQLKADPATRDIPVLFLSAQSDAADVERGLALGALGYIKKPFDPMTLGARVRALLGP